MQNQNPVLTISLLISNRPDTIPRCLDSLRPIMEAIPSELILIDTSKSEEIRQLLLGYTDKVYPFEWCNDFAKARNEGLKRAQGEWFLFLDDDEWFVEVKELIEFFQSGEYKNYDYANHEIRNFHDAELTRYDDAWVTRLFQIYEDTQFVGKVHEIFFPFRGQVKYIKALSYHSGYVFKDEEAIRKHFERNSQILLEVIKEDPINLRWQAQMVQEYRTVRAWEEMLQFCSKNLMNAKVLKTSMERNHFGTLYAGWIESLYQLKKYEESISIAKKAIEDDRSIEFLKALAYFHMAESYIALKMYKPAKKNLERYIEEYKVLSKKEEIMREQANSLVVRHVFEEAYVQTAYGMLVYCELKLDNMQALSQYFDVLKWGKEDSFIYLNLVKELIAKIATTEYMPVYGEYISNSFSKENLCKLLCGEAQEWEKKDEKAFLKIAYAFSQTKEEFWFVWYCRIILADAQGEKKEVENALAGFLKSVNNIFYLPEKVYELVEKYEIKIAVLWDDISKEKWKVQMAYIIEHYDLDFVNKIREYLCEAYVSDDWQIQYVDTLLVEKMIKKGPQDSITEYYNLLCRYAEMCEEENQAAKSIKEFLDLEKVDKIQALNKLKEVTDIRLDFVEGIGKFLQNYPKLEEERARIQKEEMQNLRNQVMQQVIELNRQGQIQAALQIVQQLKQMFPEDLEVMAISLELRLKTLE